MQSPPQYQRNQWSVPVPVRPSHLSALSPEHQVFNVQVDLAQLPPFGYATGYPDDAEFLYADLQSSPTVSVGLRLGSGRAGYYRGKYLKGVGRTQLAGNWRNVSDVYHGTGHMMASAAIREYIVSCYLQAKGAGHLIVPCEGLLLGPLHKDLYGYEKVAFPGAQLCPIDLHFQAISIKGSEFARQSNFVWALNHPRRRGHYGALFGSLYHYLTAACGRPAERHVGPGEIAAALSSRTREGLSSYATFLQTGVYWGSFSNNFTLDGRFLDLEVPQILGRSFIGLIRNEPELPNDLRSVITPVVGCEAIDYIAQVRYFIQYLVQRLRFLLDTKSIAHPVEKEFVADFVGAIETEFSEGHVIMNRDAAIDNVLKGLLNTVAVPPSSVNSLRRIVLEQYDTHFHHQPSDLSEFKFRKLSLKLAKLESFCQYYAFYPDFLPMDGGREEAEHINRALDDLDQSPSLDHLMRGVARLASEIRTANI